MDRRPQPLRAAEGARGQAGGEEGEEGEGRRGRGRRGGRRGRRRTAGRWREEVTPTAAEAGHDIVAVIPRRGRGLFFLIFPWHCAAARDRLVGSDSPLSVRIPRFGWF